MGALLTQDFASPITLVGEHVLLRPLRMDDASHLAEAVRDGNLFDLWWTNVPTPEEMPGEIEKRLSLQASGAMLPFTVVEPHVEAVVGMTTFMNIDARNRRLEIGSTWYASRVQRTALNTEAKLLLLQHAFEQLQCIAVEFRTHFLNAKSRQAIERLGARLDGVLRAHSIAKNGTLRDTCVYSLTAAEWPATRDLLRWHLKRPR